MSWANRPPGGRPTLNRWAIVLVLLVALGFGAYSALEHRSQRALGRAWTRFVAERGPLDPALFMLPEIEPEDNAAWWIQEASRVVEFAEDEPGAIRNLVRTPPSRWTAQQQETARRVVEANRSALELFEGSIEAGGSSFEVDYGAAYDPDSPDDLVTVVRGTRLMRLEAKLALLEGDRERLTTAGRVLFRTADSLARESHLIFTLVGINAQNALTDHVHDLIALEITDTETLERAAELLRGPDFLDSLARSFHAEAVGAITAPERSRLGSDLELSLWERWTLGWRERSDQADLLDAYLELIRSLDRPWAESHRARAEIPLSTPRRLLVPNLLIPNLIDSVGRVQASETARALARAALDLWRQRIAGEPYPETLELEGLGLDAVDPYSGEEVLWEFHTDGTALIAAPGAAELWEETQHDRAETPHFEWRLPEPTGAPQSFR